MMLERTEDQIEDQINEAEDNRNKFPGMTYAEGVSAALRWVLGWAEETPMED